MEISGSQIKLLKRLYKTDIPLSDFSESEKGEIEYLGKRGFIKILIQESHQPLSAFSQLEKLFMILMQETADGGISLLFCPLLPS